MARAGSNAALSERALLDARAPTITLIAPQPGDLIPQGAEYRFLWHIEEEHFAAGAEPVVFTLIVDGELILNESLPVETGGDYHLDWLVSSDLSDDAWWRVAAVDSLGNQAVEESGPFGIGEEGTGVPEAIPTRPVLAANYPNPFNPATTFRFALPEAGPVKLSVYDARGRRVTVLVDGPRERGWHELRWRPAGRASGVYLARLECAGESRTRKLVLLK